MRPWRRRFAICRSSATRVGRSTVRSRRRTTSFVSVPTATWQGLTRENERLRRERNEARTAHIGAHAEVGRQADLIRRLLPRDGYGPAAPVAGESSGGAGPSSARPPSGYVAQTPHYASTPSVPAYSYPPAGSAPPMTNPPPPSVAGAGANPPITHPRREPWMGSVNNMPNTFPSSSAPRPPLPPQPPRSPPPQGGSYY